MIQLYLDLWPLSNHNNYETVAERLALLSGNSGTVRIIRDDSGKPRALNAAGWHFNLSHSANLVCCGYSRKETGIDMELHRKRNFSAIADIWFHPQELRQVQKTPESFYPVWTRKEAWLKMKGKRVWDLNDTPDMSTESTQCKSHTLSWQNCLYSLSYCLENPDNQGIELLNFSRIELVPGKSEP